MDVDDDQNESGRRNVENRPVRLDIGLGDRQEGRPERLQAQGEGGSFSLRHFLRDSAERGQADGSQSVNSPPSPRLDMASALPDFVQDHLIMEQSYLGSQGGASFRLDNIPERGSNAASGGSAKGLPDFLSDGPIRNKPAQQSNMLQEENERLQVEIERMRQETSLMRQQLRDEIQRNEALESELNRIRSRSGSDNTIKLEEDLTKMTNRAKAAERKVSMLKEDLFSLKQAERNYGDSGPAAASTSAHQTQSERLASQLRNAATTAEVSLRQLLNGVDNLRSLANSLQPLKPSRCRSYSSDSSEEDKSHGC